MKRFLLLIVLVSGISIFSQKNEKFKEGVKIIEKNIVKNSKESNSILFTFKGHTHLINFFKNLEKGIKSTFKNKLRKDYGAFKLGFNYELDIATNSIKHEVESVPKKKHDKEKYESIYNISLSEIKFLESNSHKTSKQNYNIYVEDIKSKQNFKLNVSTCQTILTQNKEISKLIYQLIMKN